MSVRTTTRAPAAATPPRANLEIKGIVDYACGSRSASSQGVDYAPSGLSGQPQHRTYTDSHIPGDAPDAGSLCAGSADRSRLVGLGILKSSTAEPDIHSSDRLLRPIANCRDLMAEYLPIRQFNRGSVATDPAYRSGVSNVAAKEGRWISKNDMSSARK